MVLQQAIEVDPELERRFDELVARWINETGGDSSGLKVFAHPAYHEILGMGQAVLPLIFRHLEGGGYHWYGALAKLTGADPVPDDMHDRAQVQDLWLAWGREHGWL